MVSCQSLPLAMNVTLEPFTLRDALWVLDVLPEEEIRVYESTSGLKFDVCDLAARLQLLPGMRWTFEARRQTAAIGGVVEQIPGVYRTWFFAPEYAWQNFGRELTETVGALIRQLLADKVARRIETVTLASQSRARTWYEKIGLTYESTLRGYGANGEDAVLYVAVAEKS